MIMARLLLTKNKLMHSSVNVKKTQIKWNFFVLPRKFFMTRTDKEIVYEVWKYGM